MCKQAKKHFQILQQQLIDHCFELQINLLAVKLVTRLLTNANSIESYRHLLVCRSPNWQWVMSFKCKSLFRVFWQKELSLSLHGWFRGIQFSCQTQQWTCYLQSSLILISISENFSCHNATSQLPCSFNFMHFKRKMFLN